MRRFALLPTLVAALGLVIVGCGDDPRSIPPGSINIHWLIGASGCELAGVETVAVFISGERSLGTELVTFDCRQREGTVTGLPPGVYDLSLRGRDAEGVDRYAGEVGRVEVRSNDTTRLPTVSLEALPAEIWVVWFFEDGRFCRANGVETIEVAIFDDDHREVSEQVPCAEELLVVENLRAKSYVVRVLGLDDSGRATFFGRADVVVDRGDVVEVEIELSPEQAGPRPSTE